MTSPADVHLLTSSVTSSQHNVNSNGHVLAESAGLYRPDTVRYYNHSDAMPPPLG